MRSRTRTRAPKHSRWGSRRLPSGSRSSVNHAVTAREGCVVAGDRIRRIHAEKMRLTPSIRELPQTVPKTASLPTDAESSRFPRASFRPWGPRAWVDLNFRNSTPPSWPGAPPLHRISPSIASPRIMTRSKNSSVAPNACNHLSYTSESCTSSGNTMSSKGTP